MTKESDALPRAVRGLVAAARRSVKATAPKGTREVACRGGPPKSNRAMWKLARWQLDGAKGYVVGLGAFSDHATLFFPRGRDLDDGSGLLEGRGKQFRYVTLRTPADASRAAVKRVLRAAFRLATS